MSDISIKGSHRYIVIWEIEEIIITCRQKIKYSELGFPETFVFMCSYIFKIDTHSGRI